MADVAPAPSPEDLAVDRDLDQVLSILKGHGLDVRPAAVRNAMWARRYDLKDYVAAAETVVEWVQRPGYTRSREAAVLLDAALRAQRTDPYHRAERWAKRVLPDEIPLYVVMAVIHLSRAKASGWPVAVTRNSVLAHLRAKGRDRASFVDCPDCPTDGGRCPRCCGARIIHRSEVTA